MGNSCWSDCRGDFIGVDSRDLVVPFIPGDGIGPEIMGAARAVIDAAVTKSSDGEVSIRWQQLAAGEAAFRGTGEWLPATTLEVIRNRGVALKGPLTTPIGGGIRSLNVMIRQVLDLYASVRPVRYFKGVPSPAKYPQKVNLVIFRENTEDLYKGIEWKRGSREARELLSFLKERMGVVVSDDSGLGIKPISEFASKRLVRAAIEHALRRKLRVVTLVHKGNIMKFTEGAFRDWGYDVARTEFREAVVLESELGLIGRSSIPEDKLLVNDRIADNMFQQVITRPEEYSVLAAPNLNGDYLADACAALVGGLGIAPGANIGDSVAVFEAVHGTAPKYAGKNLANPCSLILSGAMMLEHIGLASASQNIVKGLERTLSDGILTNDFARILGTKEYGTQEFAKELLLRLE